MKLPGILMYFVHWGKSNCTRPVLMSVLDSFFGKCPRERASERRREGQEKKRKEHQKRKGGQTFQQIYQVRVDSWAKEVWLSSPSSRISKVWLRLSLPEKGSLYRKLNHVSGQVHVVVSASAGLDWTGGGKKSRQRASVDKVSLPRTGPRWSGPVGALSLNELMRIRPNHFFNSTFI